MNVMSSEVRRLQVFSKGLAATVDPSISPGATKIFWKNSAPPAMS